MPHLKPKKRRSSIKGFKRLPKTANGGIELLLVQSVDHLGKQGDVVSVRPGYANNYLLPQGLATIASDHHKRMVEKHREKLAAIEKARLKKLLDLAAELSKQSVTIEANASDEKVVVVDDVLNSGATLLYGVAHFLTVPVGRITTVVLVDRNHKRYPVKADIKGLSLSTSLHERVEVDWTGPCATYLV